MSILTTGRWINRTVPVPSPAFFHLDTVAFFEAGKAEHACHKLFLLVVASGYTKYVPAI
jgi:hypothetical protein